MLVVALEIVKEKIIKIYRDFQLAFRRLKACRIYKSVEDYYKY